MVRLKSLCRRCEKLALKEDKVRATFAIGHGRGQQGFRKSRTLFSHAKRLKGGGKKTKCPELGFELYQWLVDTVDNLKCRVSGWMLIMQAYKESPAAPNYNLAEIFMGRQGPGKEGAIVDPGVL